MMPDKMKIKLGDFDISKAEEETEIFTAQKGTLAYISPEILDNKALTTKADIWV
jgi:serine/threonine protein kinase